MSTTRAKQLIRDNLNIPTLPEVLVKVSDLINDPESGTYEIGNLIAEDAPMAAKVLRIANSAFYALREPCLSTESACSVLGLRVLRNVVMQAAVIRQFDHLRSNEGFDLDELWTHSILTAQTCAFLARRLKSPLRLGPEELYVCGLLHDIGKLVMLESMGEEYAVTLGEAEALGDPLHAVENARFGFAHTDVGALLAKSWGLPEAAVDAIQYHHGPRDKVEQDPSIALIANANLITTRVACGDGEGALRTLDKETTAFITLDPKEVPDIVEFAASSLSTIEV